MNLVVKVRNVLRGFKQVWGKSSTKRQLWDTEYAAGRWNVLDHTEGAVLYDYLQKYASDGSILDLGCGSGNTANEVTFQYRRYVGVDVSAVAVQKATDRSALNGRSARNSYAAEDVLAYVPEGKFDVILLRESVYYISPLHLKGMFLRYSAFLNPKGVFIITIGEHGTKKARRDKIYKLIDENFNVVERITSPGSDDAIVVFRC